MGLNMAEGTWVRGRGTARVQGAGGRLRWCPSVLLPESLEPRGLAAWFVPLRRRFRQCRAVSPECWSRAVVSGLSDYGRLRLRQRGRGPRFSHRSGVDYTRRPLPPGSARGIGAWLVNLVRPPEPSRSPRESCRLFPVPARRGAPRPPRRARPVRRTPWPRHRRGSRGAGRRAMSARIPGQRTLALLLAGLAMFGPFSIDMIFPAFPAMGVDLGADKLAMQQTISIYLVAYALMSLVHGPLSDLLGRRRVILTGLVVFAFASAGCALSTDMPTLLAFRALQGLSAGVGLIVGRAVIRDVLHGHDAQRLMSQVSMIFGAAPAIAPIVGGWLLGWGRWTLIFWFLVGFTGLLWLATWRWLPETLPPDARLAPSPRRLLRDYAWIALNPRFQRLAAAGAFNFGALFLYIASAPAFVLDLLRLDERSFGWFFIPMIGGMMLGAFTSGRAAGRISGARLVDIGFACSAVAVVGNIAYSA